MAVMKFNKGDILVPKGKQFPDCAIVVDGYDHAGRLVMHPLGGGIQTHLTAVSASVFRLVDEAERDGNVFRRRRFAIADSDMVFTGWANGQKWNGWEMPRFEFQVCTQLLGWIGDGKARYDGERDTFITVRQNGQEETWPAESITITDGSRIKVYPLGAGSWMWKIL